MRKTIFTFLLALAASVGMSWADPTIYSGFTVTASSGGLENHEADKLVDGKFTPGTEGINWTKWSANEDSKSNPNGLNFGKSWWVDFNSAEPIAITGYILTSSNEGDGTPIAWTLDAKLNAEDDWTTITGVANDYSMQNNQLTDYSFDLDIPGTYQYFRFKVPMTNTTSTMQLCELRFTGADGGGSEPSVVLQVANITEAMNGDWEDNYDNELSAGHLPNFQAFTEEEAQAWTGATSACTLIYGFNDMFARYVRFDGEGNYYESGEEPFTPGDMYDKVIYAEETWYYTVSGGSTPEPEPESSDYSIALDDASIADKVILSANESEAGQTVTVAPAEGYEITSLTVSYLTNNYSVRVKEYYGDTEDVDPQVVTLPREFTVSLQTGDDGSYTYNDISGGDDKVEYVSRTDNTLTFRVTGAFDGIASIEYEYYTEECDWNEDLEEYFCWDQTSIQDIQVACSQIGGNADVTENAGVYSFTMPAGNVTISATVEEVIPAGPTEIDITANVDPQNPGIYYATFFDSSNKYELPNDGTEAYAAEVSGDAMYLHKIAEGNDVLPAGTAVILKASSDAITLRLNDEDAVPVTATNHLKGVDIDTEIAAPAVLGTCYVLSGGENGVGFYLYEAPNKLKAHKAYIDWNAGSNMAQAPRRLRFVYDQATGIENGQMTNDERQTTKLLRDGQLIIIRNGVEYNAAGQRIK